MKKILILINLAIVVGGCKVAGVTDGTPTSGGDIKGRGYEFSYKGHQYIVFVGYDEWGVVHDPDCPRHENESIPVVRDTVLIEKGGRER